MWSQRIPVARVAEYDPSILIEGSRRIAPRSKPAYRGERAPFPQRRSSQEASNQRRARGLGS